MTLQDLLEELKRVDSEIWDAAEAWLQGTLQRAIAGREGWSMYIVYCPSSGPEKPYWEARIWPDHGCYTKRAETCAEALLAAYVAAARQP